MDFNHVKENVVKKAKEFGQFAKENMMDLAGTVTILATGAFSIGLVAKAVNDSDKSLYDKKNNWFVVPSHKLSNIELGNMLKESRENGKTLTEILCERDNVNKVFGSGTK